MILGVTPEVEALEVKVELEDIPHVVSILPTTSVEDKSSISADSGCLFESCVLLKNPSPCVIFLGGFGVLLGREEYDEW